MRIKVLENNLVLVFKNDELLGVNPQKPSQVHRVKYKKTDGLTAYKWSLLEHEDLQEAIFELHRKVKTTTLIRKPKVVAIFPDDIYSSEKAYIRSVLENDFARKTLFIPFSLCCLRYFFNNKLKHDSIALFSERGITRTKAAENPNEADKVEYFANTASLESLNCSHYIENGKQPPNDSADVISEENLHQCLISVALEAMQNTKFW